MSDTEHRDHVHGEGDDLGDAAGDVAAALEADRTGQPGQDVHVRTEDVIVEQATAAPGEQRTTPEED